MRTALPRIRIMLNPFTEIQWKPDRAELRKFAVSLMIGFPVLAVILALAAWWKTGVPGVFPIRLGAGGLLAGALLWPAPAAVIRPFYLMWYVLAACIGLVLGNLLFAMCFYLVLTPIGLALRLAGRRPLQTHPDPTATTYWHVVGDGDKALAPSRYYQQF